jgi:Uma2 family endonuclease
VAIRSRPLTYDDLRHLREGSDERLELIEGEIVVTPSPTDLHQLVVLRLGAQLNRDIIEAGRGMVLPAPFDVVLDEENVLQPDLFILLHDRAEQLERNRVAGPPSLAIEVLSSSTAARDRRQKRDLHARHGVPEYWLFSPDERNVLDFSDLHAGSYKTESLVTEVLTSVTIPGLVVDLKKLFAPVPGF